MMEHSLATSAPRDVLLQIFRRLDDEDIYLSIPFVCIYWRQVVLLLFDKVHIETIPFRKDCTPFFRNVKRLYLNGDWFQSLNLMQMPYLEKLSLRGIRDIKLDLSLPSSLKEFHLLGAYCLQQIEVISPYPPALREISLGFTWITSSVVSNFLKHFLNTLEILRLKMLPRVVNLDIRFLSNLKEIFINVCIHLKILRLDCPNIEIVNFEAPPFQKCRLLSGKMKFQRNLLVEGLVMYDYLGWESEGLRNLYSILAGNEPDAIQGYNYLANYFKCHRYQIRKWIAILKVSKKWHFKNTRLGIPKIDSLLTMAQSK